MAEYIERDALEVALNHRLNFLMAEYGEYDHYTSGFDEAVTGVEDFPAADVAPVRHGRWETANDGTRFCSHCGCDAPYAWDDIDRNYINSADDVPDRISNYCPNCGAKMDLKGE